MKKIIIIVFGIFTFISNAQDFSALWEGHFSYLNIKDVAQGNNKVYAASENAIFIYDLETLELSKIRRVRFLPRRRHFCLAGLTFSYARGLLQRNHRLCLRLMVNNDNKR